MKSWTIVSTLPEFLSIQDAAHAMLVLATPYIEKALADGAKTTLELENMGDGCWKLDVARCLCAGVIQLPLFASEIIPS